MKRFWMAVTLAGSLAAVESQAQQGSWIAYDRYDGCIGTVKCRDNGRMLRVPLDRGAIDSIRFDADARGHGRLRVEIDGRQIDRDLEPRRDDHFTLRADGIEGRELTFEVLGKGDIDIQNIEILSAHSAPVTQQDMLDIVLGGPQGNNNNNNPYSNNQGYNGSGQWVSQGERETCIGNHKCRDRDLRIRLQDSPVYGIRFRAHVRNITGPRSELQAFVDNIRIDQRVQIGKSPQTYEIRANGERGNDLILEVIDDNDVVISDIEILYGN